MVSLKYRPMEERFEFYGLSTDTKPTETFNGIEIANAATFFEIDTSTVFIFDKTNKKWYEVE